MIELEDYVIGITKRKQETLEDLRLRMDTLLAKFGLVKDEVGDAGKEILPGEVCLELYDSPLYEENGGWKHSYRTRAEVYSRQHAYSLKLDSVSHGVERFVGRREKIERDAFGVDAVVELAFFPNKLIDEFFRALQNPPKKTYTA